MIDMERPNEKDYFKPHGKYLIMDHSRAKNFIDAQNEYIDYLKNTIQHLTTLLDNSKT